MPKFDEATLRVLDDVQEPVIRTERHPKSPIVIWVVVADGEVFVRSWLGVRGRWYKDLAQGGLATLEFDGRRVPVQAIPAGNPDAIARTSREILKKYAKSSHAQEMVRGEILETTLRLEPRKGE